MRARTCSGDPVPARGGTRAHGRVSVPVGVVAGRRPGSRYPPEVTDVEVFIDPSCPWAWITSRWLLEVAPERSLSVTWRSFCLEIRDDYGVAPTVPETYRQKALDEHAVSHRMLRIFEAARAEKGEAAVDRLYDEWGTRNFTAARPWAGGPPGRLSEGCRSPTRPHGSCGRQEMGRPDTRCDGSRLRLRWPEDADTDDRRPNGPAPRVQRSGDGSRPDRSRGSPVLGCNPGAVGTPRVSSKSPAPERTCPECTSPAERVERLP